MAKFADKVGDRKSQQRWSARVVMKYTLLQLPGTALLVVILLLLQDRLGIATWLLWGIVGLWITKDIILFPLVWRSYDPEFPAEHSLVGAVGVAQEQLAPSGYVRVEGALWHAEVPAGKPIKAGRHVRVRERRGLTLIVEPFDLEDGSASG
ncbi:MAG: NfeD family protein [Acidiferrobacterales bacterium]